MYITVYIYTYTYIYIYTMIMQSRYWCRASWNWSHVWCAFFSPPWPQVSLAGATKIWLKLGKIRREGIDFAGRILAYQMPSISGIRYVPPAKSIGSWPLPSNGWGLDWYHRYSIALRFEPLPHWQAQWLHHLAQARGCLRTGGSDEHWGPRRSGRLEWFQV